MIYSFSKQLLFKIMFIQMNRIFLYKKCYTDIQYLNVKIVVLKLWLKDVIIF